MTAKTLSIPGLPSSPADHRQWGAVAPGFSPLIVLEAIKQHKGLGLLITPNTDTALTYETALKFFNDDRELEVLNLPDWETLPYDNFSPHEDIISQRVETLYTLPKLTRGILIIPISTLLHKLAPTSFLQGAGLLTSIGQTLNIDKYRLELEANGYRYVDTVYEHGEYAIRGSILDIYPMGSELPIRIELFDDEVETLRTFDTETQRSLDKIDRINLLPANEFPWDKSSRLAFRTRWHEQFESAPTKDCSIYKDVQSGIKPPGIEYYLPLFFDESATLFDYLPSNTLIFTPPELHQVSDHYWRDIHHRYEERRHDRLRPILPPEALFVATNDLFSKLKSFPRVSIVKEELDSGASVTNMSTSSLGDVSVDAKASDPLSNLRAFKDTSTSRILICAESAGRQEALEELFSDHQLAVQKVRNWNDFQNSKAPLCLTIAPLSDGFNDPSRNITIISESELFGQRVMQRRRRKSATDSGEIAVKNLSELRIGAPVVHIDNGVGRYQGLQTLEFDGQTNEFLMLEYAQGAKLYVPVSSLHLISRYSGTDESLAPLHKLGSDKWSTAKQKAAERIRDTAAELLDVYARREARVGFAATKPDESYQVFCAGFPFEETPDQAAAIEAVENDMLSSRPMDRLICGDVGFGKTEVAMRAAFISTNSGKQVAVLVPTTLLAQQHYESFKDRFADTPVQVELLSRFRTTTEQNKALSAIENGKADIIIGTHKLIQKDVKFKELGLVIIDEEHRFGVQQKERLKSLRAEVDILNLTATPIPRTLNMAMGGIRDLSIIATPPARRLSVKTFVRERDEATIKEAILRELLRGGQVYLLHNEVKTIDKAAEEIQALVQEARVGVAHGQMRERELEQRMSDFYHKRFNVLVCSTIIETGIDIPSANTIIIERADKFGLAQLHQLRGRVGRSHHQAYAYLLTPNQKSVSPDATKRLEAISAAQDLGAGFMLATHDLEIRGAGELLGDEQSGQIQSIGFTLYMEMLEQAVEAIKEGKTPDLDKPLKHGAEINLRIAALIPDDYLPDVHNRLILYKRIANAKNKSELTELQVEMIDRFGLLPDQVKNLFRQTELKLIAESLGIIKLDAGATSGRVEFSGDTDVDPLTIIQLIQANPSKYRLDGASALKFEIDHGDTDGKLKQINQLLATLSKSTQP
ncbi:transcription-repair coupling factor [Alkalimarinus alittae]|uniref:Transcription-repair-coupling factor n=1 Tax=Alkalimarinus alittae TaxID=2961619 RepID=A0ABY6MY30_9ALTE|nr:transcription-repair coupling factor [Alkalimarinus alittae]UZE94741.1 transcription-repair coupling factor [Alkalimarinus alittae]